MDRIIIDAMGGDHAPGEIVKGALKAAGDLAFKPIFVGDSESISRYAGDSRIDYSVIHTPDVVTFDDDPTTVVRKKPDSSMMLGLKMMTRGEALAFVSAGNTGALIAGSTLITKRIPHIRRVALAPVLPFNGKRVLLLDAGANSDCTPEFLHQFAIMGQCYMQCVYDKADAAIGLLNIGTESSKGSELARQAYKRLYDSKNINFIGNIEPRSIFTGDVDVVVTDGFTGNVFLKTFEGTASFMAKNLKAACEKNVKTKIGAMLMKSGFDDVKSALDYNDVGGAVVIGANAAIFKAHGSSKAAAIYGAIKTAKTFADNGALEKIRSHIR